MENGTDIPPGLKRFRPCPGILSLAHFRRGFGMGVAALLSALPSMAWVWLVSPSFLPAFCILAVGILSWNSFRGLIHNPADRGRIPLRVFLDLLLVVVGRWLYLEIRLRIETGNVFGAVLTLGITAPVLLLLTLAFRSYLLDRTGRRIHGESS